MGIVVRIFIVVSNSRMHGLGHYYGEAFAELGHEVLVHGLEDAEWLTLRGRVVARVKRMRPLLRLTQARQREQLMAAATGFRPDIVIFSGASDWGASLVRYLKNLCRGRVVVITTDHPMVAPGLRSLEWLESLAEFDTVFVPTKQVIPIFYQLGAKRVALYHFSYNPKLHFPRSASGISVGISYLGCWGPLQEMWLDRVAAEFPLRIYGWGWQHASKKSKARACWAKGEGLGSEMGVAISSSKITFNMVRAEHGCPYSTKTLEIPACGGFMLTNWSEDQAELFEGGQECVYYNTMDEMVEKAKYYLENDGEREKIRLAGMAAAAPYSYKNSAIDLLSYIETGRAAG